MCAKTHRCLEFFYLRLSNDSPDNWRLPVFAELDDEGKTKLWNISPVFANYFSGIVENQFWPDLKIAHADRLCCNFLGLERVYPKKCWKFCVWNECMCSVSMRASVACCLSFEIPTSGTLVRAVCQLNLATLAVQLEMSSNWQPIKIVYLCLEHDCVLVDFKAAKLDQRREKP